MAAREELRTASPVAHGITHAPDAWQRWGWVWQAIFYGLLALAMAVVLTDPNGPQMPLTLGLAAVLGGWYWLLVGRHGACYGFTWRTMIYFCGALPLWYVLVGLHPAFYLVLFSFYNQTYSLLTLRWAIAVSLVVTLLSGWRSFVGQPLAASWVPLLSILLSTMLGSIFAVWISAIIRQSSERRHLIEELEQTRRDLITAERQAGMLEERQRLAGEIHDTLAQGFTSIVMHLEAADAALTPELGLVRRHLDQARGTARESLAEARRVIWALRPELHEQAALPEALAHLTTRWSEESGISAQSMLTGTPCPLRPDVEVMLIRVAREALTNVRKHAQATSVDLTLSYMHDLVVLDIQDNGVGIQGTHTWDNAQEVGGFGLPAMRERVTQAGGTFTIESLLGEGTTIVVEVPINETTALMQTGDLAQVPG